MGGILNLGESREQRVEMAFELAELDPTSVPINLLNPRAGTKFGDRDLIDPWEAVKFIAIFRLILPEALFRLCGGRVENLGELQPLAVKAGLNGVMMGNFLTTLGSEPEDDREMFEELGLNVARQDDNGANPRPGQPLRMARRRAARHADRRARRPARPRRTSGTRRRSFGCAKKASRPPRPRRPRPRPRAADDGRRFKLEPSRRDERDPGRASTSSASAACTAACAWSPGRRARACCSTASRVLLLCSNNYLGLADHPRVREAAAEAAMRYGVGAGASRLVSGNMTLHRRLEERLADVQGHRALRCCSARATSPTPA